MLLLKLFSLHVETIPTAGKSEMAEIVKRVKYPVREAIKPEAYDASIRLGLDKNMYEEYIRPLSLLCF